VATIDAVLDHPRLVAIRFEGPIHEIWEGIARHGRPIQYTHVPTPLELWDVWTPIAALPVAFEPPSAGFVLEWSVVRAMRNRGIELATITLAAGISSTGDVELDGRLPLNEPYRVSAATASAIRRAKREGRRVVAVGTTVVRALEHAATPDGIVRAGDAMADERIGPSTRLRIVDAILSGTHEPGSSHYQLLRAFADDRTLVAATTELESHGYRTHEFGDSIFIENRQRKGLVGLVGQVSQVVPHPPGLSYLSHPPYVPCVTARAQAVRRPGALRQTTPGARSSG
jgi:S-adenosylmethionine:tRNA ribosyltransferase-isomerase